MKILVTGNLGYVGTVLISHLKKKNIFTIGYDIGYFKNCNLQKIVDNPNEQIIEDIRKLDEKILRNVDCVIHLAALSNDPLGELDPRITREINYESSINLGILAKKYGVKKFIYISTQSLYGISKVKNDLDEYDSIKNPITEYAKTKYEAEQAILQLNDENFKVVSLRPATVFGYSPRFRSDIVFNNLLSVGYCENRIVIKSDGTPIRPIIHIDDLCKIIFECVISNNLKIMGQCFNVGYPGGNFTVNQLAATVKKIIKNCEIEYSKDPPKDERTYSISFNRLKKNFSNLNLNIDLEKRGLEMLYYFDQIDFAKKFKEKKTIRLEILKKLIKEKKIDKNLNFLSK